MSTITLRGVRVHNLKNIDVEIPLHRLTVVTGVSGAGKSSLVFDTLYAEAQRRYLQSFSVYTRQFLERFEAPDADAISDLPPAVAIRRSAMPTSPRVTVGTLTEIDAPLRHLFARAGTLVCPGCRQPVQAHRTADVLAALDVMPAGTRATIAFPMAAHSPADLEALQEEGYFRIQIGRVIYRLGEQEPPIPPVGTPVWVLLDRIEVGKTSADRLSESVDGAFRRGEGRLGILTDTAERIFDQRFFCSKCNRLFPSPEPRRFDADDPLGACPTCDGAGTLGKAGETCATCGGQRLNADALAVQIDGRNLADWQALRLSELLDVVKTIQSPSDEIRLVVNQVRTRLQALVGLDLGYLTLRKPACTLSDGPARRIALAAALASNLVNVLYLIDEPTVGMPPRDAGKIRDALLRLRDLGNTVVVIEHDRTLLSAADHLIDLGPGAGDEGGNIAYQGTPAGLADAAENPTSDFWTGRSFPEIPERRRAPSGFVQLNDVAVNPLQNTTVEYPLGVLCVVARGVSGESRSTVQVSPGRNAGGTSKFAGLVLLDQAPFGRGSRSNPATYLKILDEIRELFAETTDAKIRNYGPGHFSFNQADGRCETCEGQGTLTIDMQFLADVRTICPDCQGRRYRREILAIKVRSLSIAEVLDLTVREAFRFFRAQARIVKKLKVLLDVGLDYLRIGQSMETLSGSECQRLKLAGHLASSRKSGYLFLLMEPSAGLHPSDVWNLLDGFERLLSAGHSLIVIDNNLDMIRSADWVIELDSA